MHHSYITFCLYSPSWSWKILRTYSDVKEFFLEVANIDANGFGVSKTNKKRLYRCLKSVDVTQHSERMTVVCACKTTMRILAVLIKI